DDVDAATLGIGRREVQPPVEVQKLTRLARQPQVIPRKADRGVLLVELPVVGTCGSRPGERSQQQKREGVPGAAQCWTIWQASHRLVNSHEGSGGYAAHVRPPKEAAHARITSTM